jgi:5-formyltetrahydrofolate cyclo-ligase
MTPLDKNMVRSACGRPDQAVSLALAGQLAEQLRRLERYRRADRIYFDPSPLLKQARINALADGKVLVMPGPGLKEGFYCLEPYKIPFAKLALAVNGRELPTFGRKIADRQGAAGLELDLLVGEFWAVDDRGYGLGEGKGFFDLAVALLAEYAGLAKDCQVMAVLPDSARLVAGLPIEPWDVPASLILTPDEVIPVSPVSTLRPVIVWEALTLDRIRRITPLWKLYVEQGRDGRGQAV